MKEYSKTVRWMAVFLAMLTAFVLTSCTGTANESPAATAAQSAPAATAAAEEETGAAAYTTGSITMESANIGEADSYTDWAAGTYTEITLEDTGYTVSGQGAEASGNVLNIKNAGTYVLSGALENGVILVDAGDNDEVRLVLNGVSLTCADGAPLFIKNADKTTLSLAPGTVNTLADGASYTYEYYDTKDEEPTAAIFSKDDLVINGTGTLNVTANYKDAITGNDDIKIIEGTLNLTAADDGIVGKDMVAVVTADVTIDAGGDGIKSSNDTDAGKGFIAIANGSFDIAACADGLQAETELYIEDGRFDITAGGGAANTPAQSGSGWGKMGRGGPGGAMQNGATPADGTAPANAAEDTAASEDKTTDTAASFKALKADSYINILGGVFHIDSADDAVHSNGGVAIAGGTFNISTGDDGIHADNSVTISAGTIDIAKCYEGIEGTLINISGGEISVVSSDDGINVAGGNDSSGNMGGRDSFAAMEGASFTISGGTVNINASGDGLDTNGSGYITGGTIFVSGPENNGNAPLDYNGVLEISGGTLIAAGSAGMAMAPSSGSTQVCIAGNLPAVQKAGSTVTLKDETGSIIASFAVPKAYQNVVFSSPVLEVGATYFIAVDGAAVQEVTVEDTVTTFALAGNGGMGGGITGGRPQRPAGERPEGNIPPDTGTQPGAAPDAANNVTPGTGGDA